VLLTYWGAKMGNDIEALVAEMEKEISALKERIKELEMIIKSLRSKL